MRLLLALIVSILCLNATIRAQEAARSAETAVLREMFEGTPLRADQFTPDLLAAVPLTQIQEIVERLRLQIGPPTMVRIVAPGRYVVVTETHELAAQLTMNGNHDIMGIFFSTPSDLRVPVETLVGALAGGDTYAYLVMKNGEVLFARNEAAPLAVGSAFKLGILAVLNDQITAGERAWSDVAELTDADRSLPTGILQTWATGAPLTLHTLASLMISMSDNTATDILLRVAGRDAVEKKLGAGVISTREFFVLKANPDLLERYAILDRTVFEAIAERPLPAPGEAIVPHQPGAEWYIPLTTLCQMMGEVGGLDPMHINPGVAQPGDWDKVAFKGGSEIGVFNLTTRAIAKNGDDYCVAATWNDDTMLQEQVLSGAYSALLSALARS